MPTQKPKYYLNSQGEFVIENYNFAKPFASFFPGIAAKFGIPMWVFYVNRGQAIASFGTKDKDHAIVEFLPANKAWQLTSTHGFRTFIKVFRGAKTIFYESFHNGFVNLNYRITNRMLITSYDLKIEETNLSLGLKTGVEYFTIPNDSYAALARIVTIKNMSKSSQKIELLDGLPQIIPYGVSNLFLKKLSRTVEAWMNVENLAKGVPFYKLDVDPTDRPEVYHIKGGNFYLGFSQDKEKTHIISPIIDPEDVFGTATDFCCPRQFLSLKNFRYHKQRSIKSKTPCGLFPFNFTLRPQEEKTFYFLVGYMPNLNTLNASLRRLASKEYLAQKREENKNIIAALQQDIDTASSSQKFNLYIKQTYLDNIMRGGYPVIFKTKPSPSVYYLYSRKHGDLERDYNKFQLQPTYFSQGNGNYRDANQNRRCDVWFNPAIKDENIITFFSLIQADGYNPLIIKGVNFRLRDTVGFKKAARDLVPEKDLPNLITYLEKPFTPGEVILFMEENKIKIKSSYDEFLNMLISYSEKIQEAEHGEGFWTDHWTYNLDLIENYLAIYPENLKEIIFEKKVFTFFDNTEVVNPRREKYLLKDGVIRQFHSVVPDNAKRELIRKRTDQPHLVRTEYGHGQIYQTTLINKLSSLLANKLACLDPFGVGIEMEANKPNWYDALNGLPGLFGSSTCETFELKRLALFIKEALKKTQSEKIFLNEEIREFLINLDHLINEYFSSNSDTRDYEYWDKSHSLKEDYNHKIRFGFSGKEIEIASEDLNAILDNALKKIDLGINRAKDIKKNIYYSYFINEVAGYERLKEPFIQPTKFIQKKLPLFLEGQVHALRLADNTHIAELLDKATRASELYDRKLKMYKITASLKKMPEEIGRCRVFPPGWLEHESIWLHMEYKYLLELLKSGLAKEFYRDFKNALIPFQKPEKYGRSILENSSFIVSSAFADKNLHGNGFVARLSGSTAEFLNIWLLINIGKEPFFLNAQNELNLCFSPILAGWLFDRKGNYGFNFLSNIKVTYYNPKKKDTFGKNAVRPQKIILTDAHGKTTEINGEIIPSPFAEQIRSRLINRIDVYLM